MVFRSDAGANLPGTHVLAIGVNHYRHLPGGSGRLLDDAGHLQQLTSPVPSAKAFAEWFTSGDYDNPEKPLATVDLVLSNDPGSIGANPAGPGACASEVNSAITEWLARCKANSENIAIFFFCGHGADTIGYSQHSLFLEDYGSNSFNSFQSALNFTALANAMSTFPVTDQVFFVDACRSQSLLPHVTDFGIQPLEVRALWEDGPARPVQQQVFHSTLRGEQAFAQLGRPSPFTQAVLRCLQGFAATQKGGEWRMEMSNLVSSINFFMEQLDPGCQRPHAASISAARLNRVRLSRDDVPTFVSLPEGNSWAGASFAWRREGGETGSVSCDGDGSLWREFRLREGYYRFTVEWDQALSIPRLEWQASISLPYTDASMA